MGSDLVAYATSHERDRVPDWRFATSTETWAELPEDPLPPMFDRSIVAADGGRSVLLVGARLGSESAPGDVPNLAARLDLASMTWSELPPSPSRGFRAWGVGDRVVLEPHFGGTGGLFDDSTGTWSDLPGAASAPYDPNGVAGALGPDDAVDVEASGWVFDVGAIR